MKTIGYVLILISSVFLAASCANYGPFYVGPFGQHGGPYGAPTRYGEGLHPGIDFHLHAGTPIIAVSDGVVNYSGEEPLFGTASYGGGFHVSIIHEGFFRSVYSHLSKSFVEKGQTLKRGQLIGLSGSDNGGNQHLHFGICRIGGNCSLYSQSYDPKGFWLGGEPQCFDRNKDYSNYSGKDIILPIACGDYAKALTSKTRKGD